MFSFEANSIHQAVDIGVDWLLTTGIEEESRNGPVLVAPGPVCTTYLNPREHVLLSKIRDANPFFHFMEALWMLSGANDIAFPCYFNNTYGQFSDDGKTMWDAYGFRWRNFFGWDQLEAIVTELRRSPTSRRCVLAMWNGMYSPNYATHKCREDYDDQNDVTLPDHEVATHGGKAVPCNTHAYFDCRGGKLNMTVCNRSNDVMFGCYGANVVHFSLLLEYMAMRVGVPVGFYNQFSHNFHAYLNVFSKEKLDDIACECSELSVEQIGTADDTPAMTEEFDADLQVFMSWARSCIAGPGLIERALAVPKLTSPFFHAVAVPIFLAWYYRKVKDEHSSAVCLEGIDSYKWRTACTEWVERRKK